MYLGITGVKPLSDYRLELTFENDEKRIFDVKPYLHLGKLSELTDKNVFESVRVSFDTIEWDNGVDLDPELLYEESTPADTLHSA